VALRETSAGRGKSFDEACRRAYNHSLEKVSRKIRGSARGRKGSGRVNLKVDEIELPTKHKPMMGRG